MPVAIRPASPADAPAVATIYDHHARHGTATFDLEGPGADDWVAKISAIQAKGWPFLVAEDGQGIMGFAYSAQFRDRPAYALACEDSIYIANGRTGQGAGTAILQSLIEASRAAGFQQMIAVIGGGEPASVAVHQRCGFVECGRMHNVGLKFGRLLDVAFLQRDLTTSA